MKEIVPNLLLKSLLVLTLLVTVSIDANAQAKVPFGCNGNYYVVYGNNNNATGPTSIDKTEYDGSGITATFIGTTQNYGFNGADINPLDGFMYSISYADNGIVKLLKIDANANVTVVSTLPLVGNGDNIFSGCFDSNGDFYISDIPTPGTTSSIYKIDVTTGDATFIGSTGISPEANGQLFFVDMAINPRTGILYGVTGYCCGETGGQSRALYTIDKATGLATKVAQLHTADGYQTTGYGLFFIGNGSLFLYGTDANFYYVDKATALITSIGKGQNYTYADGCGCSYRIDHLLQASASVICIDEGTPSLSFAFTETFINNKGIPVKGISYKLELDKRFQYTQTPEEIKAMLIDLGVATTATTVNIYNANGGINNAINIAPVNIPYSGQGSKVSFTLNTKYINSPDISPITVASELFNLPAILGGTDLSDDPVTIAPDDSTYIDICTGGPLAVKFISLNANTVQNNVEVKWETLNETNVLRYEVERSADGIHFSTIAVVNVSNRINYSYTDKNAGIQGKLYYRINGVDITGKEIISPIVFVKGINKVSSVNILTNPFKDDVQMEIYSTKEQLAQVQLLGADGKVYKNYTMPVSKGTLVKRLENTHTLSTGMYAIIVSLSETGEVFSKKIIKQ